MEFDEIIDDVWISIFEEVEDPSVLATLVRTCRRFHRLASKLLLKEIKWVKPDSTLRNLEAWNRVYSKLVTLPRKVTIGIPFDHIKYPMFMFTPEMELHDSIHEKLLQFTSLNELVFTGTLISPYTYRILASIPTLRSLRLENCNVFGLQSSFRTRTITGNHTQPFSASGPAKQTALGPITQFHTMSILHLSLHGCTIPPELDSSPFHPLCLLTAPMLSSLSITWTANISARYAQNRWSLPSLNDLVITMPLLSRELLDELAGFVDRCPPSLKVQIKIEKHNLSDTQITTIQIPLRGLWNYEGPLAIIASSALRETGPSVLTHVKVAETLELPTLLDGLARFPRSIEALEIQVGRWDIEVLFAVKALFRKISKLVVKYVRGGFPSDIFVRIGADILFCLPELRTIKLLGPRFYDSSSTRRTPSDITIPDSSGVHPNLQTPLPPHFTDFQAAIHAEVSEGGGHWETQSPLAWPLSPRIGLEAYNSYSSVEGDAIGGRNLAQVSEEMTWDFPSTSFGVLMDPPSFSDASTSPRRAIACRPHARLPKSDRPPLSSSQAELGDYLIGWSRYCRSLRVVQIDHQWWWERKFDGDQWTLQREQDPEKGKRMEKGKERERFVFV